MDLPVQLPEFRGPQRPGHLFDLRQAGGGRREGEEVPGADGAVDHFGHQPLEVVDAGEPVGQVPPLDRLVIEFRHRLLALCDMGDV